MLPTRNRILATLLGLALAGSAARVEAVSIYEPNDTVGTAAVLPAGLLIINDDLSGNMGRPDTLLGHYDPAYGTLFASNDNSSPLGNGFASQLVDVPLQPNGSAYFRVTGAADTSFIGAHAQSGAYYVQYDLYDSNHVFFKTLSLEFETVSPGFVDNIWFDPPAIPEPERVGGTVNVTVQNIVGPGSGDSVDFFLFSGLNPNQAFTALLSDLTFDARLGLFGGPSNLLLSSDGGPTPTIAGTADGLGRALLAVTGAGDDDFLGVHAETGDYTLMVIPMVVPEPSSVALLAVGGALVCCCRRRNRRQRS